jgi:sugar diacid utilization regulator
VAEGADRRNVAALEAEVVRLNKIVSALMDRSEAAMDVRESDFGLFQTTVRLQDQVRRHTEELEAALGEHDADAGEAGAGAARDMQTLRRTAALQIQLLELVVQEKDVGELVDRVASILEVPIVLYDTQGQVVHASGRAATEPGLPRDLWEAYEKLRGLPGPHAVVDGEDERIYFREVLIMDRVERVLAALVSRRQPSEFAAASLLYLQQLITLELLRKRDELKMRRRVRRGLLRDILAGRSTPRDLRIRLEEQGFSTDSVLRLAVVEPAAQRLPSASSLAGKTADKSTGGVLRALDGWLSQRRIPFLSLSSGPTVLVLTSLADTETSTAAELLRDLHAAAASATSRPLVAGCSAPLAGVESAPRCLQQARAACMAARRSSGPGGRAVFDELSGHLILLDGLDQKALSDIVQRTFAPLIQYDAAHRTSLYKTLYALFENHLAVQQTADELHIHRNTLQKRMAHVEELLGIDLDELDDIVDVRLGLQAAVLLGQQPA